MKLNEIRQPPGARKKRKRVGRGSGSGHGKTSCRGHKGQAARSGSKTRLGFEGGQMPLIRRIPKRGFTNKFKKEIQIVNIESLNVFENDSRVTFADLVEKNLIKKKSIPVKILGNGRLEKKLIICANKFSKQAAAKIEECGGKVELINA
ncbi:MAG: 50S ribosomal protein L15 [Candidatus Omnitrophota bacterium]